MRGLWPNRPRGADHAFVSMDFEEVGSQSQMLSIDLFAAFPNRLLAIFRIDVDRADEPLLPERAVRLHHAPEPANPKLRDLHQAPPSRIGGHLGAAVNFWWKFAYADRARDKIRLDYFTGVSAP